MLSCRVWGLLYLVLCSYIVAIAIKMTSQGPMIFAQERVGLNGRAFKICKFRSMVVNAEELKERLAHLNEMSGPVFKIANDPRVTALGRFIRKTSIDELPQLFNVFKGDVRAGDSKGMNPESLYWCGFAVELGILKGCKG